MIPAIVLFFVMTATGVLGITMSNVRNKELNREISDGEIQSLYSSENNNIDIMEVKNNKKSNRIKIDVPKYSELDVASNNMTTKKVSVKKGETFSKYFEEDGGYLIEYKINDIKIYNRLKDSKISLEECDPLINSKTESREEKQEANNLINRNKFILVDITAKYKEKNTGRKILLTQELWADNNISDDSEEMLELPECVYFSKHAKNGDINFYTGEKMTQNKDYDVCSKVMKPGDRINYQLGILASEDLVEKGKVYLKLNSENKGESITYTINLVKEDK